MDIYLFVVLFYHSSYSEVIAISNFCNFQLLYKGEKIFHYKYIIAGPLDIITSQHSILTRT